MTVMRRPITPPNKHDDGDDNTNSTAPITFDESKMTMEPEELDSNKGSNMPPSPTGIDINAHLVPDTVLVALLDRKQEMGELVQHNQYFFQGIQRQLGATYWPAFEKVLYSTRQQLPDKEWMSRIELFLKYNTPILNTLKELVGYVNDDDDKDE